MRRVAALGVGQAVLPPHPRPDVEALRRLGFSGSDADVLAQARRADLLPHVCSASAMWTANAATVAPSADTADGRVHLTVANLSSLFHRSLEAPVTTAVLNRIFSGESFAVHPALPPTPLFSDEGAANHTRLTGGRGAVHLFGWGRSANVPSPTSVHPARQSLEASMAVARLNALPPERVLDWQQAPAGIDAGAFHSDVLAVGNESCLLLHEHAFIDADRLVAELSRRLGDGFTAIIARQEELSLSDAVESYLFNSELLTLPSGKMALLAPEQARQRAVAWRFLERVVAEDNPVSELHTVAVTASMKNGGGPACLRLRVCLDVEQERALDGRVLVDDALADELEAWIECHYRDRLGLDDLSDPKLLDECRRALDELTGILALGSIYDFQKP